MTVTNGTLLPGHWRHGPRHLLTGQLALSRSTVMMTRTPKSQLGKVTVTQAVTAVTSAGPESESV